MGARAEGLTTEVGQRLAGTEAQARAADWVQPRLKGAGFTNIHVAPNNLLISPTGTPGALRTAFKAHQHEDNLDRRRYRPAVG